MVESLLYLRLYLYSTGTRKKSHLQKLERMENELRAYVYAFIHLFQEITLVSLIRSLSFLALAFFSIVFC